jgi:class I fructose-bisphosphate aldolase/fructose-bisphosphate aldolase/2-amino-3,7-dideoxy-D-threo-hept-6-ulosonate synthase
MSGKQIRWNRFHYPQTGVGMIVPIDHGLTIGPVEGLNNVSEISQWIGHEAITGVIAHKGMVERLSARGLLSGTGVMVHLNGMSSLSPTPDRKEMLTSVESAVRLGADGVSVQVNFDGKNDAHNLALLGGVVDSASRFGLPVLTMLYDKVQAQGDAKLKRLRHLMRITIELGSDAIKIAAPESTAEIPHILEGLCEDTSVFFAGGPLCSDTELFELARAAIENGGAGLCVGRNVFQRPCPAETLTRLGGILNRQPAPSSVLSFPREAVEHGFH